MKRLLCTLALLTLTGCPTVDWDVPIVGEPCTCQAGEGMVITEVVVGDNGDVGYYCAAEVGNPPLALCNYERR